MTSPNGTKQIVLVLCAKCLWYPHTLLPQSTKELHLKNSNVSPKQSP